MSTIFLSALADDKLSIYSGGLFGHDRQGRTQLSAGHQEHESPMDEARRSVREAGRHISESLVDIRKHGTHDEFQTALDLVKKGYAKCFPVKPV